MRSKSVVTALIVILLGTFGFVSLLWPGRPEISPGGPSLGIEEREVLTEVAPVYRPELARFPVRFKKIVSPYRLMGMFVMPGEAVDLAVISPGAGTEYEVEAEGGAAVPQGDGRWAWHAPSEPGLYRIHVDERSTRFSVTLNAFVMRPYAVTSNTLNGYRIGNYETTPYRGDSVYLPPRGFVEVTPEVQDVLVSPHFTLGQFLCKQEGAYPKYLLLREELLLKLEMLLKLINEAGIPTRTFHVMSAYRTPFYNRLIGNTTSYSRHLYGGAADIFVDADDDGYMDDLNADGETTREDAVYMADVVERQTGEPWYEPLVGGLGIYGPAAHRGPFIHIDVRGKPVRW